jgi:excisionase family DNA binding protein
VLGRDQRLGRGDLLTVPQALEILPVGRSTLYALCDSGAIPHYRIRAAGSQRGRILIAREDLEAYLAGARQSATRTPTRVDVDGILARVRRERRGA